MLCNIHKAHLKWRMLYDARLRFFIFYEYARFSLHNRAIVVGKECFRRAPDVDLCFVAPCMVVLMWVEVV